jgi:hypothetical protein
VELQDVAVMIDPLLFITRMINSTPLIIITLGIANLLNETGGTSTG